jgi:hypothetical protein
MVNLQLWPLKRIYRSSLFHWVSLACPERLGATGHLPPSCRIVPTSLQGGFAHGPMDAP